MILYKYYGYEAGLAALRSQRLGFRSPNEFNDPMELSFPCEESDSIGQTFNHRLEIIRQWVVILSLSTTPTDHMMWAHYGEAHAGFVIGYDASDPFLNSSDYSLITADDDAVSYSVPDGSAITGALRGPAIESLLHFSMGFQLDKKDHNEIENFAKLAFLTKHPRWNYEKEVRVVKVLTSAFEEAHGYQADPLRRLFSMHRLVAPDISCALVPGLHLFDHKTRILEVYIGARNPLRKVRDRDLTPIDRSLVDCCVEHGWKLRGIQIRKTSWELATMDLDAESLLIDRRRRGLTQYSSFDEKTARFLRDKLTSHSIDDRDEFELTTWDDSHYLKRNGEFI